MPGRLRRLARLRQPPTPPRRDGVLRHGDYRIYWTVDADAAHEALQQLPPYLAERSLVSAGFAAMFNIDGSEAVGVGGVLQCHCAQRKR
jgi:hypothetical protein